MTENERQSRQQQYEAGMKYGQGYSIQDQIDHAVNKERERCAKIADDARARYESLIASISDENTWQWAINEMSDAVNETWNKANRELLEIAAKIRSGE